MTTEYTRPPYIELLERLVIDGKLAQFQGQAVNVTVLHDDDCPRLRGGQCCCDPDIAIRQVVDRRN